MKLQGMLWVLVGALALTGCPDDESPSGGDASADIASDLGADTGGDVSSDPGQADPGTTDPGAGDPGQADPGQADPGTTDPGAGDPGATDPGADPGAGDAGDVGPGDIPTDTGPPPTCADYCTAVVANCTGGNEFFPDEATCLAYCGEWASLPAGSAGDTSGNTIACRLSHAELAASDPATHCEHAGPTGGGVCGEPCDVFCDLALATCEPGSAVEIYADADACQSACAEFPLEGSEAGDSYMCRFLQLAFANIEGDAATYCPGAAADGGEACVPAAAATCADYCAAVTSACTGVDAQYASEAECLTLCDGGLWDLGTVADQIVDTVGCRLTHANLAADGDPATHCRHAGPSGGGVCGSWCESYCGAALTACAPGGANEVYADETACLNACDAGGMSDLGQSGDASGDTVQCRLTHALLALEDPDTHCQHASEAPTEYCLDPSCEVYCDAVMAACTDANAQYEGLQACLDHCGTVAGWDAGTVADTDTNTVGCRYYHAQAALDDAATHCPHAGPSGGGVCGSWCDNYCQLAGKNCGPDSGSQLYADDPTCQTACQGFATDGGGGDLIGDTVQCRLTHLAMAWTDPTGQCAIASAAPLGFCLDADCGTYCASVTAACVGDQQQYADQDTCVAYCENEAALPIGIPGEQSGNSVACRLSHAKLAASGSPTVHCDHAGPTGGGVCGSWCDNYCDLMALNCPGEYADPATCQSACGAFAADGAPGDLYGDSVQCRLTHAGTLAAADGATHCGHAAEAPTDFCLTPTCEDYCTQIMGVCTGGNQQYEDQAQCLSVCSTWAGFPTGTVAEAELDVNTLGCRLNHVGLAVTNSNPALHCPLAGPGGGGGCGTWCENYCDLADRNCTGTEALYDDRGVCLQACNGFPSDTSGAPLADSGNSVQCRILQLILAGDPAGAGAPTYCAGAAVDGGDACVDAGVGGGETCAEATLVPGVPFFDTGTTTGAADDYDAAGTCPGYTSQQPGGPDVVYRFTPPATGTYTIEVEGPDILYIVTSCGDVAGTCTGFNDFFAVVSYEVDLDAGTEYFIIVDGFSSGDAGAYTFSVTSPCSPDCGGKQCGDDGCGGSCGTCTGGQACSDAQQCVDPTSVPGNTCADPFVVTATPFSVSESTLGASNDATGTASCFGATTAGGLSPEQVYAFTPPSTWLYQVSAVPEPTFDVALYAADACDDVAGSCRAGADDSATGGAESLKVAVAAGTPVSIFVDGGGSATPSAGDYTLDITEVQPNCFDYCVLVTDACSGADAQYGSLSECIDFCVTGAGTTIASGSAATTSGNSIGCRMSHALLAVDAPATHCAHAGPTGGGVCGDYCLVYCQMVQGVCTGGDQQYATENDCLTTCSQTLAIDGAPGDLAGDTVQCRLSHVMLASSSGATATHCPHGGPSGGEVCIDTSAAAGLVINELDYLTDAGGDTLEFFELYNSTGSPIALVDLTDVYVATVDGATGAIGTSWNLAGTLSGDIPAGGYVVFGSDNLTSTVSGAQAIALGAADLFADGGADGDGLVITQGDPSGGSAIVIDALAYDGDLTSAPTWWGGVGTGATADTGGTVALARCPSGADTDDNSADFALAVPTPGADNVCPTVSYAADVVPVVELHCSSCHNTNLTANCSGGGCWNVYDDTQLSAGNVNCSGLTKAECWIVRIENGSMPLGAPGTVPAGSLQTLKDWIAEGMLNN